MKYLCLHSRHCLFFQLILLYHVRSSTAATAVTFRDREGGIQTHPFFALNTNPCHDDPSLCFSVPSAPQNLRVIQMRRESASSGQLDAPQSDYIVLELKWNPPADTYGELKGYQVSYRLIGPPELLQEEAANGHAERAPQTHAVRRNVTDTSYTSTQIDNIREFVLFNHI
ncbi:unnamed protein product [Schistocephalus solidus]|uniref:Fibronectin type-III domain-containing protein n=1 Tax=Schistocephalus solidus TaxID=70667 RepID=A0A183T3C1_SCHSO|nr:unnamed protein product [Schistocephalus solidus]